LNDGGKIIKQEVYKASANIIPQKVSDISLPITETNDIFFVTLEIINTDIINEYVFIKNNGDNKKAIQEKILKFLRR
jgi:galactitol-specific phosphotransferase system IIB component